MSNPLHCPLRASQQSSYSSLGGAVPSGTSSLIRRLPQAMYTPSGKWHSANSRPGSHPPVTFDYPGHHNQGVRMQHLIAQDCSGLITGGTDRVLAHTGLQKITFRIMWTGYTSDWVRPIEVASHGPITRAKLGQLVAQNFARFIEIHSSTKSSEPAWAAGHIRFDMLSLISLINTCDENWQADIYVDFRG
ncbi:hypothetical protein CPB83DRAFT_917136 [Crepidotus variabilis]|uniref:Uncharacterized protein n=1 Tax=Crepidotus variabilis TaxID=179855 RepID=A0A9P6E4Q8_9AGAR|nr:hypothetical protein CPB83DRAFT_917867 [Crepidotus variabilis]KAF9522640.1 hypothetical protein CPB83DRAFT_917136 [Crepidotus variabilis]